MILYLMEKHSGLRVLIKIKLLMVNVENFLGFYYLGSFFILEKRLKV